MRVSVVEAGPNILGSFDQVRPPRLPSIAFDCHRLPSIAFDQHPRLLPTRWDALIDYLRLLPTATDSNRLPSVAGETLSSIPFDCR